VPSERRQQRGDSALSPAAWLAWIGVGLIVVAFLAQDPAPPTPASGHSPAFRHAAPIAPSPPISLTIPSLGVSSSIGELGLDADRQLEVPADPEEAGWYRKSAAPGAAGSAVIAGHVTWDEEPAAFFDLGALRPGQRVHVHRLDGQTAIFAITRIAQYDKDEFPTDRVYGPSDRAELRLITCGGRYDADTDTYDSNVVAYGTLVATRW